MSDWREIHLDQNHRMANKMLDQQGEINTLRAERDNLRQALTDVLLRAVDDPDEVFAHRERLLADRAVMLPVFEAARAWAQSVTHVRPNNLSHQERALIAAIESVPADFDIQKGEL